MLDPDLKNRYRLAVPGTGMNFDTFASQEWLQWSGLPRAPCSGVSNRNGVQAPLFTLCLTVMK